MRTTKGNIAEKVIDNLLTTCQSESELNPNFAPLKQETDDLRAKMRQNQTKLIPTC